MPVNLLFNETIVPPRSGSEGSYITFAFAPTATEAVMDGNGLDTDGDGLVFLSGVSYVRLCGLTVRRSGAHGMASRINLNF